MGATPLRSACCPLAPLTSSGAMWLPHHAGRGALKGVGGRITQRWGFEGHIELPASRRPAAIAATAPSSAATAVPWMIEGPRDGPVSSPRRPVSPTGVDYEKLLLGGPGGERRRCPALFLAPMEVRGMFPVILLGRYCLHVYFYVCASYMLLYIFERVVSDPGRGRRVPTSWPGP